MIGVIAFLGAHWVSIAAWSWLGLTAVGATMPEMRPRTLDDFYHWGYDAVHQFANLKNQRPTLPSTPSGNLKQQ